MRVSKRLEASWGNGEKNGVRDNAWKYEGLKKAKPLGELA
jgi:hypothetical protein